MAQRCHKEPRRFPLSLSPNQFVHDVSSQLQLLQIPNLPIPTSKVHKGLNTLHSVARLLWTTQVVIIQVRRPAQGYEFSGEVLLVCAFSTEVKAVSLPCRSLCRVEILISSSPYSQGVALWRWIYAGVSPSTPLLGWPWAFILSPLRPMRQRKPKLGSIWVANMELLKTYFCLHLWLPIFHFICFFFFNCFSVGVSGYLVFQTVKLKVS